MELVPIAGMITGVFITLGFFGAIVLSVHYITTARNKEKMALIEKGVDISEIYKSKNAANNVLKYGMFLVGLAIGVLLGYVLNKFAGVHGVPSYFSMILLFGGGGLILFHWFNSKLK